MTRKSVKLLCKNCEHFKAGTELSRKGNSTTGLFIEITSPTCMSQDVEYIDVVFGHIRHPTCYEARMEGEVCGLDASLFRIKEPINYDIPLI